MTFIKVQSLTKQFKVYKKNSGFIQTVKSLIRREYELKNAVEHLNFEIAKGEIVGYIGPNGAGKSTTIKMLAGVLVPTSGQILVNGIVPHKNRKAYTKSIGVVFGQRTQLHWDLPLEDSFQLHKHIYKISPDTFTENVDYFTELLEMKSFIHKPVRQLSLGQKMRAELAAALLHEPDILYLDEPTIGLDVVAKTKIRQFIKEINAKKQTTIMISTHDMDDIEQLCGRLIMINSGTIIFDGALNDFKRQFSSGHVIQVEYTSGKKIKAFDPRLKLISESETECQYLFSKDEIEVAEAIRLIVKNDHIVNLQLKEQGIEDIIYKLYRSAVVS